MKTALIVALICLTATCGAQLVPTTVEIMIFPPTGLNPVEVEFTEIAGVSRGPADPLSVYRWNDDLLDPQRQGPIVWPIIATLTVLGSNSFYVEYVVLAWDGIIGLSNMEVCPYIWITPPASLLVMDGKTQTYPWVTRFYGD